MFSATHSRINFLYSITLVFGLNTLVLGAPMLLQDRNENTWRENDDCLPRSRCWKWQEMNRQEYFDDSSRLQHYQNLKPIPVQLRSPKSFNRLAKKDIFVSRSWGAGGMPFSVLYMNHHNPRSGESTGFNVAEPATALPLEGTPPTPPPKHPKYGVAVRNGASAHPRKQYSIIPQLFVSYGWGPLGK